MKKKIWRPLGLGALCALLLFGCSAAPGGGTPSQAPEESSQALSEADREDNSQDGVNSVSIIGGADGPTSIFIASKSDLTQLSQAVQWYLCQNTPAPSDGPIQTAAYAGLYQTGQEGITSIYIYYLRSGWELTADLALDESSLQEAQGFARLDLTLDEDKEYQLKEIWHTPAPAGEEALLEGFPQWLIEDALNAPDTYETTLRGQCAQDARKSTGLFSGLAPEPSQAISPTTQAPPPEGEETGSVIAPTTQGSDEPPAPLPLESQ